MRDAALSTQVRSRLPFKRSLFLDVVASSFKARLRDIEEWLPVVLVLVTFLLYLPVTRMPFHNMDDPGYVVDNPRVASGLGMANTVWAFTALHGGISYWHPLTWLSHQLDAQLFGLSPTGHHLTNVVLHIVNGLLLFSFLRKTTQKTVQSFLVTAVFLWHPVQVETVAWISERKSLLSTAFMLLGFKMYVRYLAEGKRKTHYLALFGLALLALMAKPIAVIFPVLLLLLDYWPLNRFALGNTTVTPGSASRPQFWMFVLEKLPLFLLSLVVGVLTILAQHRVGSLAGLAEWPLTVRIDTIPMVLFLYLRNLVWPMHLSVMYVPSQMPIWMAVLAISGILVACGLIFPRDWRIPWFVFAFLWFGTCIAPVSGIIQTGPQLMADRYLYLTIIGLSVAAVWFIVETWRRGRIQIKCLLFAGGLAVLLALVNRSSSQIALWEDDITLFENAAKITPTSWACRYLYGGVLFNDGDLPRAKSELLIANQLSPSNPYILLSLARLYIVQREYHTALDILEKANELAPRLAEIHLLLSEILSSSPDSTIRDGKRAYEQAQSALRLISNPSPKYLETLAEAHAELGDFPGAIEVQQRAIRMAEMAHNEIYDKKLSLKLYQRKKPYRFPAKATE